MRNVSDKSYRVNSKHTFDVQLLFPKNHSDLQQYGAFAFTCWITKLYRHTLGMCNTYCFSTTEMVYVTYLAYPVSFDEEIGRDRAQEAFLMTGGAQDLKKATFRIPNMSSKGLPNSGITET